METNTTPTITIMSSNEQAPKRKAVKRKSKARVTRKPMTGEALARMRAHAAAMRDRLKLKRQAEQGGEGGLSKPPGESLIDPLASKKIGEKGPMGGGQPVGTNGTSVPEVAKDLNGIEIGCTWKEAEVVKRCVNPRMLEVRVGGVNGVMVVRVEEKLKFGVGRHVWVEEVEGAMAGRRPIWRLVGVYNRYGVLVRKSLDVGGRV